MSDECVFVVEDNADLNHDLCEYLEICGFDVVGCESGAVFYRELKKKTPAAVILDIMLPDTDGYEIASYLRNHVDCGIMMLTSLARMDDHLAGYKAGTDVYLTKDSPLSVIEAALRPLLRRVGKIERVEEHQDTSHASWVLDVKSWTLSSPDGVQTIMTALERTLIGLLMQAEGQWLTRPEIVKALGKADTAENCRNLDTSIRRLRKKVQDTLGEELPVKTAYGKGYAFISPAMVVGDLAELS